ATMHKYHQLTQEERYSMTALMRSGCSQAEIARELGRSPSTISRELQGNRGQTTISPQAGPAAKAVR
uniref:helix-turn-helix domain-containing protein n=1 Tax=Aromatoleum toluclasticum TaxID=92003 RepID=UPI0003800B8C